MSDKPETIESILGPETIENILGPKQEYWTMDGQHFDEEFMEGGVGKILDNFGMGFKQGWGQRPLGDYAENSWVKQARELGLFNDIDKHEKNWVKQFNESLLRGTAGALDFAMRAPLGVYYGAANAAVEGGILPRDVAALVEAFPAGRFTGLPTRPLPNMRQLEDARRLGVIGQGTQEEARRAFAPSAEVPERVPTEPLPAAEQAVPEPTPLQPADVHAQARLIAPDTFREYDALAQQKDVLREWQESLRPQTYNIGGVEVPASARVLETAERNRERLLAETNEPLQVAEADRGIYEQVSKNISQIDRRMQEMAPEVSEAYREAGRQIPREEVEAPLEAVREPVQELVLQTPEQAAVAPANIVELSQRRSSIARDVEQQLVNAGRGPEEARAAAALVQAHYEARAARFEGALGGARDLYEAEAPTIVREVGGARRGSLNLASNTVKLFRDSDASTFIHETGHQWLEEMKRDALHEAAPADLKADLQTVKDWVGAEGDTFTRAQHEKFARGFERYLMEGQAPSSKLAKVFEKFKNWLTQIYQTVSRLRAPITDDIRGVYDRLLTAPQKEPVIIPERPGAIDFATHAEEVARETPAVDARAAANTIDITNDQVALALGKAFDNARREARRGPQTIELPREPGDVGGDAGTGPDVVTADAAFDTGRNPPQGKSEPPRSASEPFSPQDGDLVDKAGNIRVDNLNIPEDVVEAIKEASRERGGFVAERRGVLTDAEVKDLSEDLGVTASKLDRRQIGEAWNAEDIIGARRLLVQAATDVRDAMGRAAVGDMQGIIDYAIARERLLMIQGQVAGITAEAGRALRAFQSLKGGVQDANMLADFFQNSLGKTSRQLQREAEGGLKMETTAQLNKYVRDANTPGWIDKLVEVRRNALLSGPYTHVRNFVGNVAVAINAIPETVLASAINKAKGRGDIPLSEVKDRISGAIQGAQEGVIALKFALADEKTLFGGQPTQGEAYRPAIGGTLGQVVRLPGRTLSAEDAFFKAIARRQELDVQARRIARAEGLKGEEAEARIVNLVRDPPTEFEINEKVAQLTKDLKLAEIEEPEAVAERTAALEQVKITQRLVQDAERSAEYQTFTNKLGPLGQKWLDIVDDYPLLQLIFPFNRTPINIMKYAVERSPFGLLMGPVRDNLLGKNGSRAQDIQSARLALGGMLMAGVAGFVLNGRMTSGGPWRREEREVWGLDGKIPYAAKLGNTYVSVVNAIDPFSINMQMAADLAEIGRYAHKLTWSQDDKDTFDKLAFMTIHAFSNDVFGKMNFRNAADLFTAITDSDTHASKLIAQYGASLVPAVLGQTAEMLDPVKRDIRTGIDAFRARIPWDRENLQASRTVFGEPIPQTEFGPFRTSRVVNDPTIGEMQRLGITLAPADRKFDEVALTSQQYADYVRISGRTAKEGLDSVVQQPWYKASPDGIKRQVVHQYIEGAREMAKGMVQMESMGTEHDLVKAGAEQALKVFK